MPRSALIRLLAPLALCAALPGALSAVEPHLDWSLLPYGCASCHEGHGAPRTPMLRLASVERSCLACHGSQTSADAEVAAGRLAAGARPQLLDSALALPYVHRHDEDALSRLDSATITCTSCHSPHRRSVALSGPATVGQPKLSTRDPRRLEFELCESCHGRGEGSAPTPGDIASLFDASSRSYHPVHAPTVGTSPSVLPELAGRQINCTDCHGASREELPRGPHGSDFYPLLVANLTATDGTPESADTYALCYRCHDAQAVLSESSPYSLHRLHVVEETAACSTCHSAHGSLGNRALIRYGEETSTAQVLPSTSTGLLAFESEAPGSGSCYLTCHGVDHGPRSYGGEAAALAASRAGLGVPLPPVAAPGSAAPPQPEGGQRHVRERVDPPPPE